MCKPTSGTYLLLCYLGQRIEHLQIGRLGHFDFTEGYYGYVGSAFGSGGLAARLGYHRQRIKQKPHWHIDYLRPYTLLREVWSVACSWRLEATWCAALAAAPEFQMPVRGFGSSDTGHATHLFYSRTRPPVSLLCNLLLTPMLYTADDLRSITVDIQRYPSDADTG